MEDLKRILIVDDSEIDREIMKEILSDEFIVSEADNGYSALQIILIEKEHFDAILLDVSMPVIGGLKVLQLLRENHVEDVPVFMITSEATKDNIEKSLQYNISEFLKKPFDREEILKRLRFKLGVPEGKVLANADIKEMHQYIEDLKAIYDLYLSSDEKDFNNRMVDLMDILLRKYSDIVREADIDIHRIDMISNAAYFCNIGNMILKNVPTDIDSVNEKSDDDASQQHTIVGADLIRLNYSKRCRYFVQICSEMCLQHHERYDGGGFPQGIYGSSSSIYVQMYVLLSKFDKLFIKSSVYNERRFEIVYQELERDSGLVDRKVFSLLSICKPDVVEYYNTHCDELS